MYIDLFHFYDKKVCNDFFFVNKISVCLSVYDIYNYVDTSWQLISIIDID